MEGFFCFFGTIGTTTNVLLLKADHRGWAAPQREEFGHMPLMYGIAALAVLATGTDQQGVDPQIDKQYAIVKNGTQVPPACPVIANSGETTSAEKPANTRTIGQETLTTTQAAIVRDQGTTWSGTINAAEPVDLAYVVGQTSGRTASTPALTYYTQGGISRLKGMDRLVSVQFNNASAADVIKWLSKQNVNFVANVDKLPKSKITMNVNQVPLHEALETVAESLGGSWQVRGTTLIFQTGSSHMRLNFAPTRAGSTNGFEFKTFADSKAFGQMDEKRMKAFEKSAKDMSETMKAYSLSLKEFPKMDPKAFDELKSLHGLTKDGKAFEFKTIDPKAFEQLKSLRGLSKDGKALDLKSFPNLKGSLDELKAFKTLGFKKVDSEKFFKSLTSSQKELMKKQGHLKFSDLSDIQKAMLFDGVSKDFPKDFTFMFSMNGEKIVIKN